MSLMDRIKVKPFLFYTPAEKYSFIETLQKLRLSEQALARIKKGRKTKSATKNLAKRGKKISNVTQKALQALKKLSPEQLAEILKITGV